MCVCVDGGVPGAYALGTATSEREIAMASGEDVFHVVQRPWVMEASPHPGRGWEKAIAAQGK